MEQSAIKQRIRRHLAEKLRLNPSEIGDDRPFEQLGIDSIAAIELTFELEVETGRYISPGLLFEHNTVEKLSRFLAE